MAIQKKSLIGAVGSKGKSDSTRDKHPEAASKHPAKPAAKNKLSVARLATAKLSTAKLMVLRKLS